MTRFLVTGAAGFIGSHLAEALIDQGHTVDGADSFTDYYPRALKEQNLERLLDRPSFALHEVDLTTATELDDLVHSSDAIFHLAAQAGVRGSWGSGFSTYLHDNVLATQRLFEAAAGAGRRIAFASSSSVYGNLSSYPTGESSPTRPVSPYGVTKLTCENLARAYAETRGLEFVALRYFTVYGPRQRPDMALTRILRALIGGLEFTMYGSGTQSRDVTYVGDAVSATIAAMEAAEDSAILNVGGGTEVSLRELIARCEALAGRPLDVSERGRADGDVQRTSADTSLISRTVGWEPGTSLDDGLRAHLDWVEHSPATTV